jgi:hypothetical protein
VELAILTRLPFGMSDDGLSYTVAISCRLCRERISMPDSPTVTPLIPTLSPSARPTDTSSCWSALTAACPRSAPPLNQPFSLEALEVVGHASNNRGGPPVWDGNRSGKGV